uniref:DUF1499 domain-containing protein n=1 Tax=Eucampia antarctica TaxID=49252 RepID=A0A7S2W7S8_9STRA|mmetsp:Transcript_2285/g.2123  ORF Transcript_2285/g.2123 Transcript_2285/m.2123 type:complete len:194 (+) Transcript_2285:34-615(+)|eukprot:CAMPEP_0197823652 /NCGR_PEP_ID=MMETSP1437-20131217/983_1 /TAXON_ID=49252 ORGANISM="Eucampia antarctica, Strain CCMP1452" /NCGR_SAMPLE_ID=MMETSP1437 /ASSEMBLY_ACC=CAM_ASM_001096 /LENGTH=193 /DNA_ID=CAMNT_0043422933 /DNA_START=34 /DNA_END=615 /DNA_ORIENTATION=-
MLFHRSITSVVTLLCLSSSVVVGYAPPKASSVEVGRREAFMAAASAAFVVAGSPLVANALEVCPSSANNCVRTSWTPPSGTSKADAVSAVRDAVNAYPQEGQGSVDGGGWAFASDDLNTSGTAIIEYKSSGKGNFARFLNGGKPFVDDLKIEVEASGLVQIKSQSRVGDSDFGVNAKRVEYLASSLKSKGWSV